MSTDRLREAARVLRERAEMATPGPWVTTKSTLTHPVGSDVIRASDEEAVAIECCGYQGACSDDDAAFIATMHPGVALALADWLDAEVLVQDSMEPLAELVSVCVEQAGGPAGYVTFGHDDEGQPQMQADSSPAALRLADAILGGAS